MAALSPWTWYWLSTIVLALLLVVPVSRMVWVLSVRRLERRRGETLSIEERKGQRVRARVIAVVLSTLFSALFNYQLLNMSEHL